MLVILLVALVASLVSNVVKGNKIKELQHQSNVDRRVVKKFIKGLIIEACNTNSDKSDLQRRLEELERRLEESDRRISEIERRVETLEDINGKMANNTYQLIKEGRIIKSTYNNVIFPYKFHELTKDEIISFFGRIN